MTWLLDVNIDVRVKQFLSENQIQSLTSQEMGWAHLANGKLVSAAAAASIQTLLTRDNLFTEAASTVLKQHTQFAIVLINLKQQKSALYIKSFSASWQKHPIIPQPGKLVIWPNDLTDK